MLSCYHYFSPIIIGVFPHKRGILQFNHIAEISGLRGALQMFPNANAIKGPCYIPKVGKKRHFFPFKIIIIFLIS